MKINERGESMLYSVFIYLFINTATPQKEDY